MKRVIIIIGVVLFFFYNIPAKGTEMKLAVNAIQMLDASNGWAVGDNGLIMNWNGSVWTKVSLPFFTESNFHTLYFTSSTYGFVGGEGGILLFYSAGNWKTVANFDGNISSIFCIDANNMWVTSGTNVFYLHNLISDDGYMLEAAPDTMTGLYFTDSNHGWACSSTGTIYSYNTGSWNYEYYNASQHFNSVFFVNSNLGWAVGDNGVILKYSTGTWSTETTATNGNFRKIFMNSSTQGWASGDNGLMYYYNGSSWSPATFPYDDNIYGMSFLSSTNGWAVGKSGVEYRYSGSAWTYTSLLPADPTPVPGYNPLIKIAGAIKNYINWDADTLKILNHILVPYKANKINVLPGTVVDFSRGSGLEMYVPLVCKGSSSDSIKFLNSSKFSKAYTIWINHHDKDSTILSYCRVSNGVGFSIFGGNIFAGNTFFRDSINFYYNGIIEGNFSTCKTYKINNFQFSNCTRLKFSDSKIQNGNTTGIIFQSCNLVTINNSVISYNMGSGIYCYNSTLFVSKCRLHNNQSTNGAAMSASGSKVTIDNSLITNNEGKSKTSIGRIGGGAIYSLEGKLNIANSTIAYNKHDSLGGGIYSDYTDGTIYNTIFWGNMAKTDTNQFHYKSTNSSLSFINCDIHFDSADFSHGPVALYTGKYLNNIKVIPQFNTANKIAGASFNGLTADWTPKTTSPCINKGINQTGVIPVPGTDLANNNRIFNQFIDIGPYETHLIKTIVCGTISTNTTWQADTIYVNCALTIAQTAKLNIIPGTVVYFNVPVKIDINGSLQAIGKKGAPIIFTAKTSWYGMWLNNTNGLFDNNDSTLFKYCRFENINNGTFYFYKFRKLAFENSIFTNCKIGTSNQLGMISIWYSALKYSGNYYYGCNGGPLYAYSSQITIDNNVFTNNTAVFFTYLALSDVTFQNNKISNNSCYYEIVRSTSCNFNLLNNLISNNKVKNDYSKGNIYFNGTSGIVANNTIVNNDSIAIFAESSTLNFANNIVWNNPVSMVVLSNLSDWYFSNNLINGPSSISDVSIQKPISGNPSFIKVSDSIGVSSDALKADWRLLSISPCIDTGTINIPGIDFGQYDLAGNNRFQGNIDLGAFENQEKMLEFKVQPVGGMLCKYNPISFAVSVTDTANFQWQKDGNDIAGAVKANYTIPSIQEADEGNYICAVRNAHGKVFSNPAFVKVLTAPEITDQPSGSLINKNSPVTLIARADGSKPIRQRWLKDGIELPDTTFKLYIDSFKVANEGTYISEMTNGCGSVVTDNAVLSLTPSICMVTVNTPVAGDKGHNQVIFEKESKIPYDKYRIYRESNVAGYYDNIGEISGTSAGIFEDTTVSPKEQAYLYKITAVNSTDNETDINLCQLHKTIHLLVTRGEQGGIQLDWDQYIGFPYKTYYIYRSTNGVDFSVAHTMASSTRTWTDDTLVGSNDVLYYYVSVIKTDGCYPSGTRKAGSDIYSQSVSNLEDNRIRSSGISIIKDNGMNFSCYPNPYNDFTTISYNVQNTSNVALEIYNALGEKLTTLVDMRQYAGTYKCKLSANDIKQSTGVFFIRLKVGNSISTKKLVKL